MFLAMNAGKRSVALDLRRGLDVLLRLADGADVFVQSLRPGAAEERGFGADAFARRNPRLVYATIGAFGRTGPWSARPGYDPLAQAAGRHPQPHRRGGRARRSRRRVDGRPGHRHLGGARHRRRAARARAHRRGPDDRRLALRDRRSRCSPTRSPATSASGEVPGRHGTAFASIAPYRVYDTADGEVMIAAGNDKLFAALGGGARHPGARRRFAVRDESRSRRSPRRARRAHRRCGVSTWTTAALLDRLDAAGVPAAPVQDVGAGRASIHRHTRSACSSRSRTLRVPELRDGRRPDVGRRRARRAPHRRRPALGAHTADVLAEAGFTDEEIADLAADGVVRLPA